MAPTLLRLIGLAVAVAIVVGLYFGWDPALRLFRGSWFNDFRVVIGAVAVILALSFLDWAWAKLFRKS